MYLCGGLNNLSTIDFIDSGIIYSLLGIFTLTLYATILFERKRPHLFGGGGWGGGVGVFPLPFVVVGGGGDGSSGFGAKTTIGYSH